MDSGRHYETHMHKSFSIGGIDQGEADYMLDQEAGMLCKEQWVRIDPGTLAILFRLVAVMIALSGDVWRRFGRGPESVAAFRGRRDEKTSQIFT